MHSMAATLAAILISLLPSIAVAESDDFDFGTQGNSDDFITFGTIAQAGSWPWQVRLLYDMTDENGYCGGSFIAPQWILTAAHCVAGGHNARAIGYGSNRLAGLKRVAVAETFRHPEYRSKPTKNDVALLKLAAPVENAPVIVLADVELDALLNQPNARVVVTGWGATFEKRPDAATLALLDELNPENVRAVLAWEGIAIPQELRQVEVGIIDRQRCSSQYDALGSPNIAVAESEICAGDPGTGRDSCNGDSGGPLVTLGKDGKSYVQLGVVSWGYKCGHPVFPGVYARVSSFREWIDERMAHKQ